MFDSRFSRSQIRAVRLASMLDREMPVCEDVVGGKQRDHLRNLSVHYVFVIASTPPFSGQERTYGRMRDSCLLLSAPTDL